MDDNLYIYGKNPVIEAIAAGREIEKIYLLYGMQGSHIAHMTHLARTNKIAITTLDKHKYQRLEDDVCPRGVRSQGIIALMRSFKSVTLMELAENSLDSIINPIIVALDGISDPQNLGAIARSAECAGAAGIILPERDSSPVTPVALKASAGALQHLPVAKVSSLIQSLDRIKEYGFRVIGTDASATRLYTENLYDMPVVLVIGSEGKGIRPGTRKQCDDLVKIPLIGNVSSLNASASAAVILFEILRQKSLKNGH
jgi:23S rRNA (guanosine2251-2'-O)-methyltransferase